MPSHASQWWRRLDASVECPISFEPLRGLAHAPFDLPVRPGVRCYFEPVALASYLVSKLVFRHPLSRAPLARATLAALDEHLRGAGARAAARCVEAFDCHASCARAAGAAATGDRRDALQREAAQVTRHLFARRERERGARRERARRVAHGVVDDDLEVALRGARDADGARDAGGAPAEEEDDARFEDEFPTLGGLNRPLERAALAPGSFAWTGAAAVASAADFPPLPEPSPRKPPRSARAPARRKPRAPLGQPEQSLDGTRAYVKAPRAP